MASVGTLSAICYAPVNVNVQFARASLKGGVMSAAQLGLLAVVYGYGYYFLARGAIGRIMEVDAAYREKWAVPNLGANPRNSLAILHIMLNMTLPKTDYPSSLKWRIWTARMMLWLWPFLIMLVLMLAR